MFYVGIDLGGTNIAVGLVDEGGKILADMSVPTMAERDYTLIAYGYGNTAFTDYGKDKLSEVFLDDFGDDNWYSGLSDYLDKSESML